MNEFDGAIDQKLNQLAALINQRFERLEALLAQPQPSQTSPAPKPAPTPASEPDPSPDRLSRLEQQVQQLSQRVLYLERLLSAGAMGRVEMIVEDEEMEDQPDEILWEFMEPGERQ